MERTKRTGRHEAILKTVYAGLFIALALLLPQVTGRIPDIGRMLTPMHIPVLVCGFFCGWQYGLVAGLVSPIISSSLFLSPVIFPSGIAMSLELATYGVLAGVFYRVFPKKLPFIYVSLILSMIGGRIVWGGARFLFAGIQHTSFPFSAFIAGALLNSLPGIILQIVLVPAIVLFLQKTQKRL